MNQTLGLLLDSLGILQNIDQVQPSLSKVVIIYSRIDNFLKQIFSSFRVLFSPNFQNNHELGREPKRHYFDLTLTTICHNFAMTGAQSSLLEMHLELISKTYKMAVVSVFIFFFNSFNSHYLESIKASLQITTFLQQCTTIFSKFLSNHSPLLALVLCLNLNLSREGLPIEK